MHRGDTIVELVIAFAIFSLAAVGSIAILNSGVTTTQRNLEVTLVRQQVDAQAEMLRYIHDSQSPRWGELISVANIVDTPSPISTDSATCPAPSAKSFYIRPIVGGDPGNANFERKETVGAFYKHPDTYAKVNYGIGEQVSEGIWVQAANAQTGSGGIKAYDFYIHACWDSAGMEAPMTYGTIVRLYER